MKIHFNFNFHFCVLVMFWLKKGMICLILTRLACLASNKNLVDFYYHFVTFSSFFIIFHHFSSFFIIFHHFSSFFIIFHHFSSFSSGNDLGVEGGKYLSEGIKNLTSLTYLNVKRENIFIIWCCIKTKKNYHHT